MGLSRKRKHRASAWWHMNGKKLISHHSISGLIEIFGAIVQISFHLTDHGIKL